ncbi:MAG: excinuclease ABC subunit UvrA, partial [candidate division WS1 bacterium]|nr:excinuclease ABC subunit UvrA [candidate division WS1 bacterium]
MPSDVITIRGAREHNLQGLNLTLPKHRLLVFTGLSGSGKSSLAFDTLYAEGQRLYVESLSPYARQFMPQLPRPRLDAVEGLCPAIAIQQGVASHNPRSTVGTITEIYDYLRVLYATLGEPHCPECGRPLGAQSRQSILDQIRTLNQNGSLQILAPLVSGRRGQFKDLFADLHRRGFAHARVDGEPIRLENPPLLDRYRRHDVELVIDRLPARTQEPGRLAETVDTALEWGEGNLLVLPLSGEEIRFSRDSSCPECLISLPEMYPASFSFNNPRGMCHTCEGLGVCKRLDPALLVEHPQKSLRQGALPTLNKLIRRIEWHWLEGVGNHFGFSLDTPWQDLTPEQRQVLLQGTPERIRYLFRNPRTGWEWRHAGPWEGLLQWFMHRYKRTAGGPWRMMLDKVIRESPCPDCGGQRLCRESLAVKLGGKSIAELLAMTVTEAQVFFETLELTGARGQIAEEPLKELRQRLRFLQHVGLHYLTLDRTAPTLSGGEAQRLRLAGQIGSGLTDCLYVLDEPSIGLHHRDQARLIEALQALRDQDNTILVVEHDEQTVLSADWVVDFGPGAGERGGQIVAQGTPAQIRRSRSLTGKYLSGRRSLPVPEQRRNGNGKRLVLSGARANNLRDLTVEFPLGTYICVTGVSGSGKSSLVTDTLFPALAQRLNRAQTPPGPFDNLTGAEHLDKAVLIDQSPIGRTPRSNPATYTGVFTHIRELFTKVPEARARGYKPGRFSFNVAEGRCPECEGHGAVRLEADFLAEVWVPCEKCRGLRFDRETLEITYRGANIAEVLEMEITEAREHFSAHPTLTRILQTLIDVGLGYIKLGQPATTLSGG